MTERSLHTRILPLRLQADPSRTITRLLWLGPERAEQVMRRILMIDEQEAQHLLEQTLGDFRARHPGIEDLIEENVARLAERVKIPRKASRAHYMLIGAYFTMEYTFESAALCNPSAVAAVDQDGLAPGELRFAMSLRAVGEGHLSSIVFRRGVLNADGDVRLEPAPEWIRPARSRPDRTYDKPAFQEKLCDLEGHDLVAEYVLQLLDDEFTLADLVDAVDRARSQTPDPNHFRQVTERMVWLARASYEIQLQPEQTIADVVLFPISQVESQGMEDMRLVLFEEGKPRYYGTYTAFNGLDILPLLMELCPQEHRAEAHVLSGRFARNKGMALFPRPVGGSYLMLSRMDGESLFLSRSDNVRHWDDGELLARPRETWELLQIGNCGSPIETEAGWLVLTHGVGPLRRYCIGAMLLDKDDPFRVIARLRRPLLEPTDEDPGGYVPNVVYSCGGLAHNGLLFLPHGINDAITGFAIVPLDALLEQMTPV